ncbi:acetylornithine aminotransferase [Breznakibacter xylanolyticus]|uniref:Acetylornithine aminotransferase n=1 Tax=Breznakibacter xylanolyticus TaxID=990 RepID=A0A2W7NLA6_9BACT|nr:aminotransferase class III-fold pyridoxal phosphate-dependent enzyme [Breznakibacter xylanolyticus]PZX17464.1 acetylornithine aminotransferase [Breznakibacter xylanolyticus]
MKLFDVYPLFNITPVKGEGCYVWDDAGNKYLDLYGGHAVISIGHSHPHYIHRLTEQLNRIGFYSNSVQNPMQEEFAAKLGQMSGMDDYSLFLCNSGAEANENALKLASFHTGRSRVISFQKGFHGRTSAAVAATDNPNIVAPVNAGHQVTILPLNDLTRLADELKKEDVAAVIIEGIQGIGGIIVPDGAFLEGVADLCKKYGTVLVLDEIQSGYGRSGKFFAFQYTNVKPDVVTVAKGIANGFPVGGVLIAPHFQAKHGMLGTTFGGNYLACAASLAVLEVMEKENLIANAYEVGNYWMDLLRQDQSIKEVRGLGLMIGLSYEKNIQDIRKQLLFKKCIFTGVSGTNVIRLLPPLTLTKQMADEFVVALREVSESS